MAQTQRNIPDCAFNGCYLDPGDGLDFLIDAGFRFIFGMSAYPALRLKLLLGQPLMDSAVGDELLEDFKKSNPRIHCMGNLQAAVGLLQLKNNQNTSREASILEICVYPVIAQDKMRRLAEVIREWAGFSER